MRTVFLYRGRLAQLGEHGVRNAGVVGSSPMPSTNNHPIPIQFAARRAEYQGMYLYLLFTALLQTEAAPGVPLLEDCYESPRVIATVRPNETVQVISALASGGPTCYGVTTVVDGKEIRGYVLGPVLPAIAGFERKRRAGQALGEVPPPAPDQPDDAAGTGKPKVPFGSLSGTDINGNYVSLDEMKGKVTLVCFWSPDNKASQADLNAVQYLYDNYHQAGGLQAIGVSLNRSPERMKEALDDFSTSFPNMPDRTNIAREHGISAPQILLLNGRQEIVASDLHGKELQAAVKKAMEGK
jgi:hypothetical protein